MAAIAPSEVDPFRGEPVKIGRIDQPSKSRHLPVADIVQHEEEHVRRALGRHHTRRPPGPASAGRPRLLLVVRHEVAQRLRLFAALLPQIVRLGDVETLNSYFPFTPPKTESEWESSHLRAGCS